MFLMFVVVGVIGLALLLVSVVFDDVLSFLDFDTPFLSTAAIGAFLAGFGFCGLLLPDSWGAAAAVAGAAVSGVALAGLATWMTSSLADSRTDETVCADLVLGTMGTVVNRIDPGQYGEVSVTVAGHLMKYNAKSDEPLPSGARVVVVEVLSPSAVLVTGI
ncbi:MAG: hypothetical protein ACI379_00645 [Nocardioides sp.]|uniref:hypothetical protein n=1 Tax=Nocardioides sp. TaxID=35761 RepID=UPI003F0FFD66